jgi:hypothetical protein
MTYRDEPKDGDWNVDGEAVPVQTQLNRKKGILKSNIFGGSTVGDLYGVSVY